VLFVLFLLGELTERTQLQETELAAILACSPLPKERTAGATRPNGNGQNREQREPDEKTHAREQHIQDPLPTPGPPVPAGTWYVV
jgi:hypothetical protein